MGGRGGSPNATTQAPTRPAATPSAETQILQAYDDIPHGPAGYVGLADLRDKLTGLSRESQDQALRQMARQPGVHISPVANQKSLTPRDRAAALRIGEDENMMIAIDRSR